MLFQMLLVEIGSHFSEEENLLERIASCIFIACHAARLQNVRGKSAIFHLHPAVGKPLAGQKFRRVFRASIVTLKKEKLIVELLPFCYSDGHVRCVFVQV